MSEFLDGEFKVVSHDVFYFTDEIVNVIFIGTPGAKDWLLIDTGLPGSAKKIIHIAETIYGKNARPKAILLTNGHFDHSGALVDLLNVWKVNVYAHQLEFPYLCGEEMYPAARDIESNSFSKLYKLHGQRSIDITEILEALPADLSVPGLDGWEWIHTPGVTAGHTSYFRRSDRLLVAGDAFVTARHDIFLKQVSKASMISLPPDYLLMNLDETKRSITKLLKLKPNFVITGHGGDTWGENLSAGLSKLVMSFESASVPGQGGVKPKKKYKKLT